MMQRSFGDAVSVSVLGIGCGRVGSLSNPTPRREVEATLEAAVEAGVTLFDTADIYGQGDSERALGRLSRRHTGCLFIVTKVGGRHARYASAVRFAKPLLKLVVKSRRDARDAVVSARTASVVHDFFPKDLALAIDASRRRLKRDQLQGLLLHSPSAQTLGKPEIHEFLAEVLRSGKAQFVGVSVDTMAALEAAIAIPATSMIQAPLEVAEQLVDGAILDQIRMRNIGFFVREILRRPNGPAYGRPQDALSTALAQDFVTSAIVGVSTRTHLRELFPALQ